MRILVTNDDGIDAPGLHVLAEVAARFSDDVIVIAPWEERSGSGAAIGPVHLSDRIAFKSAAIPGLGVEAYAIDGPPALAVLTACRDGWGPQPDLVLAGINPGTNTGHVVIHSGTVGAALTAANNGLRAAAFSLETGVHDTRWDTAAAVAEEVLRELVEAPPLTVLNVNVPDRAPAELAGVREATLAPFGTVRSTFTLGEGEHLDVEFRATEDEADPTTDLALLRQGFATVTALSLPRAVPSPAVDRLTALRPSSA